MSPSAISLLVAYRQIGRHARKITFSVVCFLLLDFCFPFFALSFLFLFSVFEFMFSVSGFPSLPPAVIAACRQIGGGMSVYSLFRCLFLDFCFPCFVFLVFHVCLLPSRFTGGRRQIGGGANLKNSRQGNRVMRIS